MRFLIATCQQKKEGFRNAAWKDEGARSYFDASGIRQKRRCMGPFLKYLPINGGIWWVIDL
jgi:hypothetical protein